MDVTFEHEFELLCRTAGDAVMSYPRPLDEFWADILDRYRCAEVDGQGGRCQLVTGHGGQTFCSMTAGGWRGPVGAQPHDRPPWATTFPRDEA